MKDLINAKSEIVNKIYRMKSEGKKVISLAIGETEIPTPVEIMEAACKSMKNGQTHYGPSKGIESFRKVASIKVKHKNGINVTQENVIYISSKQSIFSLMMFLRKKGKEVLIPDPGYFYYEPVKMAGLKPVYYKHDENFNLDINDIKNKIGKKTAAIVLNSPSNPTGKIIDRSSLNEIYDMALENNIYIISDEAYEDITYEKNSISTGSLENDPEMVISVFSLSKSYSMTGWRAGYTVANEKIIDELSKIVENTFTSYPLFIQEAATYALQNGDKFIENIKNEMYKNRNYALKRMEEIDGMEINNVEGTFYLFPKFKNKIKSIAFSKKLLEEYNVAVLPGIVFGPSGEGHVRISFSVKIDDLTVGLNAFEDFMIKRFKNF